MKCFKLLSVLVSVSFAQPTFANDLIEGIVGGIIGGALVTETGKTRRPSSGVSSAVRQERRNIQTSLNYFGYPAGTADGILGARSRSAISNYQAFLGPAVFRHPWAFDQKAIGMQTQSFVLNLFPRSLTVSTRPERDQP